MNVCKKLLMAFLWTLDGKESTVAQGATPEFREKHPA
jgi:hypothetical protein